MGTVSKVKERISERSWAPEDGGDIKYFVKVEMQNGDKGDIMRYKTGEVAVGDELDYDIAPAKRAGEFSIKLVKKAFGGFGGGFKGGASFAKEDTELKIASFAFAYSKDLCVGGKIEVDKVAALAESIAIKMQALTAKLKTTAPKPAVDAAV